MDLQKEWYRDEFIQHEISRAHRPIEDEFNFYIAVSEGSIETVTENLSSRTFTNPNGMGILSENPLQNIRYHFVITSAIITRCCVDKGMEQERAYSLSDFYIRKMDKCKSIPEIEDIHSNMCLDFCNRMLALKKSQILSKPIVLCMDYIYSHIHSRITLKQLASHVKLSESYLSIANYLAFSSQSHFIQVFKKYEGITPAKYRDKYFRNNWEDAFTH